MYVCIYVRHALLIEQSMRSFCLDLNTVLNFHFSPLVRVILSTQVMVYIHMRASISISPFFFKKANRFLKWAQ